jgi:acetyltransferase-like isoleucine patch superfamily enzyme
MSERIPVAMDLTSRLNALPFSDLHGRHALLRELFDDPGADKSFLHPPFYCTSGVGTRLGEQSSVGQGCRRAMISPRVTLITEGHPLEPSERYDSITVAPIVIEANAWIGAAATILPGVTIGHDSVVGAGAVIAKDVAPLTVVTGPGHTVRRLLQPAPEG